MNSWVCSARKRILVGNEQNTVIQIGEHCSVFANVFLFSHSQNVSCCSFLGPALLRCGFSPLARTG